MAEQRFQAWMAVIRVLDTPSRVFEFLADRPALLPPYLFSTILGVVATGLSLPVTLRFMEAQLAEGGPVPGPLIKNWVIIGGIGGAFVGPVVAGLLISALVCGMLWTGGQRVTFRGVFSVIGYARIPLTIGALINAFMIMGVASPSQVKQLSLSPAVFAPSGASPFLFGFLSTLAPFGLWYLALVTLAVAAVSRRRASKVWWVAAVLYGLNLLFVMLESGTSTFTIR